MKRSYSRRELYALGEPLGDSATYRKAGGLVLGDGGGGGGSAPAPADKTTQTVELPEWARPYAQSTLAKGAALTDINQNPYQQYGGNRIAGFTPMQQQAFQGAANMQPSQQLGTGSDLATAAGIGALGTNYQGGKFSGGTFGQDAANFYMNPYQQNVIDIGKREAARQSGIQGAQQQAQATQAGAFGGGREAIMRAERERNLSQQMGDIQAQGSNAAFQQAQQQFNADQARRMQAQQLGEQSRQYGAGLGMQGLQTALQSAGQLGQLGGQQFQQGMDINKLQSAYGGQMQQQAQRPLDMAYQDFQNQQNYPYKQLGFMSDLVRGMPLGQKSTSTMYEAPGSTMGQLAGLGMGAYGLSRMMAADGGLMKSYADGGQIMDGESVVRYADGGDVTSQNNKENLIDDTYSIQALTDMKSAALARRDIDTANAIDERIAQLNAIQAQSASLSHGLGNAFDQIPQERQEEIMYAANGGIVAFADRGLVPQTSEDLGVEAALQQAGKSKSPFELIQDWTGDTARKNDPNSEYNRVMRESGRAPAPTMANRPQPKGAGARSTPAFIAKDTQEEKPVVKQKKLSPSMDKAITKMAEEQGVPKDEFMKTFDEFRDKLQAESKEDLKGLQDLIEKQSGKSKQIKEQAFNKAITEYGFNVAAQASEKGKKSKGQGTAGLLGSLAAASPVLAASVAESQKLAAAADDNDMKLQMEMRKFNIATRKNDSATAMQHATNMRQLQQTQETIKQQQRQLDETIRANKVKEGLLGQQIAARSGTAGLRGMQYAAKSRAEAIKLARGEVDGKIKASGMPVKPEDYDRMINQALKKYLPMTTGFGMTGVSSSKDDDDDIIDLG
jgi:hypothetical protein